MGEHSYRGNCSTFSYFTHSSKHFKLGTVLGAGDTMINENEDSLPQGTCSPVGQTGK